MKKAVAKLANKIVGLLFIAIIVTAVLLGKDVKASDQLEIYSALLTVSSIVFAVMGAWLSLLKVEIISGIKNSRTNQEAKEQVKKARDLIRPMSLSVVVIACALAYIFIYYSTKEAEFFTQHKLYLRGISFVILSALTFLQMIAVGKVLFSGAEFLIDISKLEKDVSADRNRKA